MASTEPKTEPCFQKEIQLMMFGLGDSQTPSPATALVVEAIVKQQLTLLLLKANEIAEMRESSDIELQDFIFLMRRDRSKLKRLLQYLELKDSIMSLTRTQDTDPEKSLLARRPQTNRKDDCLRFLSSIGIDDLFTKVTSDEIKLERMIRADHTSQVLNKKNYQEFRKSRRSSFADTRLNQAKLFEWLKPAAEEAVGKLKKDVVDVVVYFAKETVAELVDLALLVRQDSMAVPGDVLRPINPLPTHPSDTFGYDQNQIQGPHPITPEEIREVMRRYWSVSLCPFGAFTLNTFNPTDYRNLVC